MTHHQPFQETARPDRSIAAVKRTVRGPIDPRSTHTSALILLVDIILYLGLTAAVLLLPWQYALVCSVALGLSIALLFIVAHDACHGGFTAHPRLNAWVARICFLPSLFPVSPWEYGHNQVHHGWTNLREKDYVWRPLSLTEYRQLPGWRRTVERTYRTLPGVALYSIVEIWLKHMLILTTDERRHLSVVSRRIDRGLVLVYAGLLMLVAVSNGLSAVIFFVGVPFLVFHWLFGMVTLQHHTHPSVRWCDTRREWSFATGQIRNTVHVKLPAVVERLLHNITVHGAHHIDPRVPLYALPEAQARLVESFGEDVTGEKWSLRWQIKLLRTCRLYDYDLHRWLDYDGSETAEAGDNVEASDRIPC